MNQFLMCFWEEILTWLDPRQPRTLVPVLVSGFPIVLIVIGVVFPSLLFILMPLGLMAMLAYGFARLDKGGYTSEGAAFWVKDGHPVWPEENLK